MPLSSSGELYGEVIYVVNKRTYGSLYHYAHFICDCLFPEVVQELHKRRTVVRLKSLGQTLGLFSKIYEEVMQTTSVEIDRKEFSKHSSHHQVIKGFRAHNDLGSMLKFRSFVFARYGFSEDVDMLDNLSSQQAQTASETRPTSMISTLHRQSSLETHQDLAKDTLVLLVKRGCRRDLIADEGLKMRNKNVTCGKERREIANLVEVEENLLKVLGKSYHAVVLEELPFKEQVRLFKEADVIILAHGAAMSNLFFSSLGTLVIEIQCGASYRDFDSICQNLKLKHIKVKKFSVDVTWLLKRVADHLLHHSSLNK